MVQHTEYRGKMLAFGTTNHAWVALQASETLTAQPQATSWISLAETSLL
jgi:hypothetical protein